MKQAVTSAASPHRQRHIRPFVPALLAVLAALALIGCPASTPINDLPNLPVFSDEVPNLSFQVGQTTRPVVLPPATGGSGTLTYSLRPGVPGLTFDQQSRTLSGTPTITGTYSMTYEAHDQNRKTARLLFGINVAQSSSSGPFCPPLPWGTPPASSGSPTCPSRAAGPPFRYRVTECWWPADRSSSM